jgi:hypothetical protein
MKRKTLWIAIGVVISVVSIAAVIHYQSQESETEGGSTVNTIAPSRSPSTAESPMNIDSRQVPAHYEVPPASGELRAVLPPSQFAGKTREAYEAVKQIPAIIAQMPCYCHCDRGMGHKSLHSCFEDNHAAHCATCVDEALIAYRLQKEGLSAAQIRERIIEKYTKQS